MLLLLLLPPPSFFCNLLMPSAPALLDAGVSLAGCRST
jgi:hypothetical protein